MKNKKNMRRFLSGFLAMLTVLSTILSPILSYAADVVPVPEEPPLYEEVKNELDADEVVKAKDLELETGSIFEVEKDFTGLEIPDEKKVKITFHEAKNEEKQDFITDYEDTYKAVYYVEPVSGHPIYQINRKLIVKEAVVQVAESENQESVSNQEDENEAEGEEPAIGTAESEEPVQDEVNVEIPSEDKIYEEVTPTEIPVEEEPIDTPIPENPSEEVSTEEPAIDDNPDTDSTFEEITDTDPEEMPEATDDSFTDGTEKTEDADGNYQVNIVRGEEFHIELNHEDGQYQPGETVVFSGDMPQGSLIAVGTTKVQANQTENTEDLLYSEVTYHEESDKFSFEMPADDIDLSVSMDQAENGIMLLATDTPWDDATNIEANKYYYYSDGQLHPFDTVMGQGGNDSYKYVRYKAGGKTYTVNAYCMQHSMQSPPSGTTYKNMVELDEGGDDKYLRKALFYGYGGPGWGHTFNGYNVKSIMEKYGCSSETRAMQHYLVDYLYDGESGFGGALSTSAKNMLKEIKAALAKMPDPTAMKLLPGLSVNATGKETESFTWKANEAFTITIHLENGVSLVNETTGKTASGNVTVKGGEKFHLVATTANMGSLKGKYAITSNFPLDFHAMLLKLESSQDIGFGYYTDSADLQITVDWPEEAVIEITKKDGDTGKNLAGAVYGVYSDNACTKLIVKMPPTDSNGSSRVTLTKTQDTVYLKEITAPEGYVVQASSYGVKLVVGSTTKQTVTDKEQKGNLTVYKEGEVFVGAVSDENGTSFQYEKRRQKGAVYNVYAAEDIVTAGGKTVYKKGAEVAKNLITGENGSVTVKNLPLGSYNVTEAQAPENFYNAKETKKVTISYAGQTAEAAFSETTFTNDRQKAVVQVIKKDKDTENTLSGGHFALFAAQDMKTVDGKVAVKKDALIETAITGTDGKAAFKADLPVGFSYYVKEVQAPAGYVRNEKDTYSFQFSYTNDEQAKISFSHTFVNDRVSAAISLNKKDAETKENKAQGDASLENAVYGLYARNDITHPDGKTGVIYKAGSQIGTLTTDKEGKARIENLYLGEYYIKEITPSVGYLADEHEYDLVCSDEGDLTAVVEKECTSLETVKKQPFELIKAANNGDTDAALLSGAGFSAYLVSSLVVKEDGNYDFSSAESVVIGENGATEIFTNEKGYVKSIAIPYGTYLVRETTTPHNYKPVDDFIVRITENKPTEPQTWRVLLDKEFSAKLKIIKQDDETKKSVLIPGTEFKIYDMDHEKYVEQVTTYPTTVTHTSYFTDIDGYLILPQNLKIGHYRIEEVTAPDGYTINKNYVEIQVDTNTLYQTDPVSGDAVIEVVYEDHSVKGKLTVQKKGEVLSTYKNDFKDEFVNSMRLNSDVARDIFYREVPEVIILHSGRITKGLLDALWEIEFNKESIIMIWRGAFDIMKLRFPNLDQYSVDNVLMEKDELSELRNCLLLRFIDGGKESFLATYAYLANAAEEEKYSEFTKSIVFCLEQYEKYNLVTQIAIADLVKCYGFHLRKLDRERVINAINTVYPTGNLLLDAIFSELTIYKNFLLNHYDKHVPDYMEQEDIEFYLSEELYDLGKEKAQKEIDKYAKNSIYRDPIMGVIKSCGIDYMNLYKKLHTSKILNEKMQNFIGASSKIPEINTVYKSYVIQYALHAIIEKAFRDRKPELIPQNLLRLVPDYQGMYRLFKCRKIQPQNHLYDKANSCELFLPSNEDEYILIGAFEKKLHIDYKQASCIFAYQGIIGLDDKKQKKPFQECLAPRVETGEIYVIIENSVALINLIKTLDRELEDENYLLPENSVFKLFNVHIKFDFLHRRYIAVNQENDIIFIMKKWSSSYKGDSEYLGNVIPLYSGTELYIKREYIGMLEQQFGTLMMETCVEACTQTY